MAIPLDLLPNVVFGRHGTGDGLTLYTNANLHTTKAATPQQHEKKISAVAEIQPELLFS